MKWIEIKELATRFRNNPTAGEVILWNILKNKQLKGRKFLRQHPIIYEINRNTNEFFFYIPDFYCASEKLIIEQDGEIHKFQKEKDCKRDLILNSKDLRILRINTMELNNIKKVEEKIVSMFRPE